MVANIGPAAARNDSVQQESEDAEQRRPDFSVLCSAYQCEDFLAETIDSVVAQTYPGWELIVVDNGMADDIAEIVRGYRHDPRIRLIRQENRRLIGGMATAAAAARGRYLIPLDSDDQLLPTFCAMTVAVLDARPEIDVLSCDAYAFNDGDRLDSARTFLRRRTGLERRLTVADLVGEPYSIPYIAAFRREAWFAGGGYAPGTEFVEDIALVLRLVTSGHDIRVLPEPLARYRVRADSVSRDTSGVEAFDRAREHLYIEAAEATGDPRTVRTMQSTLRRLRYLRALRRARVAFLDDDLTGARGAAREAFQQRRTARSAAVLAGVHLAPSALRLVHPAKQRATLLASKLASRLAALQRPSTS